MKRHTGRYRRKATGIVASALGMFAGFGGPEHGYFEILRGHEEPDGLIIASMGPPCDPKEVWHLCEPAMTIIPSYLATGIVATVLGLFTMVWSGAFLGRKHGGSVLVLLSIGLLLFGGGLFPPIIGIAAGIIGTTLRKPVKRSGRRSIGFFARLWPWPLVIFFVYAFGQFPVGHYFNDFIKSLGFVSPLLIVLLLIMSIVTGHACDAANAGTHRDPGNGMGNIS